ncbi:hypothetical protein AHF37_06711 [Paragonimus kellicotti]|nr:hypothetical protein AHF37_06711 [Paragonimus kellicotti]
MMSLFVAFILPIIPLNSASCSVLPERISVSKLPLVPLVQGSPWACSLCTAIIASLQPLVVSSEVDTLGRRAAQYFCSLQTTDPQDFFLCKVIVYNFVKLALNEFYHLDQREVCEHLTFCSEQSLPGQKSEELLSRSAVPTVIVYNFVKLALNEFYHLDQREVCEHLTFCSEQSLPGQKSEELLSRSAVPTDVLDIIRMALPRSTPHESSPSLPSIQAPSITIENEI